MLGDAIYPSIQSRVNLCHDPLLPIVSNESEQGFRLVDRILRRVEYDSEEQIADIRLTIVRSAKACI